MYERGCHAAMAKLGYTRFDAGPQHEAWNALKKRILRRMLYGGVAGGGVGLLSSNQPFEGMVEGGITGAALGGLSAFDIPDIEINTVL